jgi:hypothetical protein
MRQTLIKRAVRQDRKPAIASGAPDPSKCRAVKVVEGGQTARCISETAPKCNYSKPYGSGHFCEHPDRERIVQRTLVEKKKLEAARLKKL